MMTTTYLTGLCLMFLSFESGPACHYSAEAALFLAEDRFGRANLFFLARILCCHVVLDFNVVDRRYYCYLLARKFSAMCVKPQGGGGERGGERPPPPPTAIRFARSARD